VDERVYSAAPALREPRRLLGDAARELRAVPATAWRMFIRNIQARFRQARLGYVWLAVAPAVVTLTWVYLGHAGIVHFGGAGGVPYAVYVGSGIILWQLFQEVLNSPLQRLSAATVTLKKAPVPHELWVVAGVFEALFGFAIRLVLVCVLMAAFTVHLSASVLLVPLGVGTLVVLALAVGLLLTPLGLLYQDVTQGLLVATGLWFFLTPVVYPRPAPHGAAFLVTLNPVTPVLDTTRAWLTGAHGAAPGSLALVAACSIATLAVAWLVYRVARPHLVARM
jgi:lipopolysaccharide transport system permease protein